MVLRPVPRSLAGVARKERSRTARNLERVGVSETEDASEATDKTLKASQGGQAHALEREREEDRGGNARSGWPGEPG
jgi:predicted RNA-binding protein with PUA domain